MIGRDGGDFATSQPDEAPWPEWPGDIDICSVCDGLGWAVVGIFYPGTFYSRVDERTCETCQGRRFVRVKRERD